METILRFSFFTLVLVAVIILFLGKYIWNAYIFLFIPKIKIIKAKIIRFKSRKFFIAPPVSTSDVSFQGPSLAFYQNPIAVTEYFVFLEEANNHKKYYLEVPSKIFEELKEKKISTLKNISFYFKHYFLGDNFDHIEMETI